MRNVAIVIWDGIEILDFAGPAEVFSAARGADGERAFNVYTIAVTKDPILSQGFVSINPACTIHDCPKPDIFVLPGGGMSRGAENAELVEWVKRSADDAEIALSVCTGVFLLARAGLLDGREATTHWSAIDALREATPGTVVHDDRRFVDEGRIVTSAGVSAGIDSSLHVVTRLLGEEAARQTAHYMEYDWRPEDFQVKPAAGGTGT